MSKQHRRLQGDIPGCMIGLYSGFGQENGQRPVASFELQGLAERRAWIGKVIAVHAALVELHRFLKPCVTRVNLEREPDRRENSNECENNLADCGAGPFGGGAVFGLARAGGD